MLWLSEIRITLSFYSFLSLNKKYFFHLTFDNNEFECEKCYLLTIKIRVYLVANILEHRQK